MVMDSKECLRETYFVLCLNPRKEIISGSLEWIYIVFQDAIYVNLKSLETKEVQKTSTLTHLEDTFIWSMLQLKVMGCAQGPSLAVAGFEHTTLHLVAQSL